MKIRKITMLPVFCIALFVAQFSMATEKKTVLTNCHVIDCTGAKPMKNMAVATDSTGWLAKYFLRNALSSTPKKRSP